MTIRFNRLVEGENPIDHGSQLVQRQSPVHRFEIGAAADADRADTLDCNLRFTRNVDQVGLLASQGDDKALGVPAGTLRAATGPQYGRVWNSDVVDMLTEHFGDAVTGDQRIRAAGIKVLAVACPVHLFGNKDAGRSNLSTIHIRPNSPRFPAMLLHFLMPRPLARSPSGSGRLACKPQVLAHHVWVMRRRGGGYI